MDNPECKGNENPKEISLEERKIIAEEGKLKIERMKYDRDGKFLYRNFGVVITAIVSVTAVILSSIQLVISNNNNKSSLELADKRSTEQVTLDLSKFVMGNKDAFRSNDIDELKFIVEVIVSLFPEQTAKKFTNSMAEISETEDARDMWRNGFRYVALKQASIVTEAKKSSFMNAKKINIDAIYSLFPEKTKNAEARNRLARLVDNMSVIGISAEGQYTSLAIMMRETYFFSNMVEEMKYSSGRIVSTFPARIPTELDAQKYANNPEKLANKVYGGRMGNGDEESGDGWKFRGRGYFLTTGRANYEWLSKQLNIDLIGDPDLLLQPGISEQAAAAIVKNRVFVPGSDERDINQALRRINGGLNGLNETYNIYTRIKAVVGG